VDYKLVNIDQRDHLRRCTMRVWKPRKTRLSRFGAPPAAPSQENGVNSAPACPALRRIETGG